MRRFSLRRRWSSGSKGRYGSSAGANVRLCAATSSQSQRAWPRHRTLRTVRPNKLDIVRTPVVSTRLFMRTTFVVFAIDGQGGRAGGVDNLHRTQMGRQAVPQKDCPR